MRLTVYGSMPTTPVVAGQIAKRASNTWRNVSRASTRVSLGARKRSILKMGLAQTHATGTRVDQPLQRNPSFRPIQLSIYGEKRLPDLPEFENVSFTEVGAIREPPKALLRSASDESLRYCVSDSVSSDVDKLYGSTTLSRTSDLGQWCHSDTVQETGLPTPPSITNPAHKRTTVTVVHKQQLSQSASIVLASSATSTETRAGNTSQAWADEPMPTLHVHPDIDSTVTRVQSWLEGGRRRSRRYPVNTMETTDDQSTTSSLTEHTQKATQFYQPDKKPTINTALPSSTGKEKTTPLTPKRPSPIKIYKIFPIGIAVRSEPPPVAHVHARTASSSSSTACSSKPLPHIQSQTLSRAGHHARTATASTTSTAATDSMFENAKMVQDGRDVIHVAGNRGNATRDSDAASVTTYNDSAFNSRTSTLRSIHSDSYTKPQPRQDGYISDLSNPYGDYYDDEPASINYAASSPGLLASDDLNKEIMSSLYSAQRPQSFHFIHLTTKAEAAANPTQSPWKQADEVEQYMHDMCANAGLRRVNVGVAF